MKRCVQIHPTCPVRRPPRLLTPSIYLFVNFQVFYIMWCLRFENLLYCDIFLLCCRRFETLMFWNFNVLWWSYDMWPRFETLMYCDSLMICDLFVMKLLRYGTHSLFGTTLRNVYVVLFFKLAMPIICDWEYQGKKLARLFSRVPITSKNSASDSLPACVHFHPKYSTDRHDQVLGHDLNQARRLSLLLLLL